MQENINCLENNDCQSDVQKEITYISEQTLQADAKIFKALCDEKRLSILGILRHGEQCACKLIDFTGISQSALSYHMKILCDSGLVQGRSNGKWVHYSLCNVGREQAFKRLYAITELNV